MDPDSQLITATAVIPANTADAQPAPELINDLLNTAEDADTAATATAEDTADTAEDGGVVEEFAGRPTVYGDSAYGSGEFQGLLQQSRINSRCRTQPAAAPGGRFTKDRVPPTAHRRAWGRTPQGSSRFSAVSTAPILGDPSRSAADPRAPHSTLKREEPKM